MTLDPWRDLRIMKPEAALELLNRTDQDSD